VVVCRIKRALWKTYEVKYSRKYAQSARHEVEKPIPCDHYAAPSWRLGSEDMSPSEEYQYDPGIGFKKEVELQPVSKELMQRLGIVEQRERMSSIRRTFMLWGGCSISSKSKEGFLRKWAGYLLQKQGTCARISFNQKGSWHESFLRI